MKKFLYIFLLTLATSVSITSCTEENIKPQTDNNTNGGGNSSESKGN